MSLPAAPVMTLASALPVPVKAAVPVAVRFSTLVRLASEYVASAVRIVSVPAEAASVTRSPVASTT